MPGDDHSFTTTGRIQGEAKYVAPLLADIAAQAAEADRTRSVASGVITSIKKNDIMRMSASREISGLEESIVAIANELRAIAPRCGSTAWCLWNHLCVFHHFAGILGPPRFGDGDFRDGHACQFVIETGVPTDTLLKKISAIRPGMRMQPCEAG